MDKQEFLDRLGALLACLPAARVAEWRAFYAEAIDDRMEEGMTEEQAVAALGSPGAVADAVLDEMPPVPRVMAKTRRHSRVLLWVALILGSSVWLTLLLAFAAVALAGYLCIWLLAATLWLIAGAGVLACPIALVIALAGALTGNVPFALAYAGEGLLAAALGLACLSAALASSRRLAGGAARRRRERRKPAILGIAAAVWLRRGRSAGGVQSASGDGLRSECVVDSVWRCDATRPWQAGA